MADSFVGVTEGGAPTKRMATQQITRGGTAVEFEEVVHAALPAYTTPTHTAPTVTSADTTPLAANAARRYVLLVNDSDEAIYLAFGVAAVAHRGIRLGPAGGAYEMSAAYGNLYVGAIHAIHAGTGAKILLVTEGT
jgi:hypothetical protein